MNLVGLVAQKRAGKDTAADGLVRYGWQKVGYSDPVYAAALALDPIVHVYDDGEFERLSELVKRVGWDSAKEDYSEVRQTLERIGTEVGREQFGYDFWVDFAERTLPLGVESLVFRDVRFKNEAEMLRIHGGIIVKIVRPDQKKDLGHPSRDGIHDIHCDFIIFNDSTPEVLQRRLIDLVM